MRFEALRRSPRAPDGRAAKRRAVDYAVAAGAGDVSGLCVRRSGRCGPGPAHDRGETRELLALAKETSSLLGVVGWVDLACDVERQLGGGIPRSARCSTMPGRPRPRVVTRGARGLGALAAPERDVEALGPPHRGRPRRNGRARSRLVRPRSLHVRVGLAAMPARVRVTATRSRSSATTRTSSPGPGSGRTARLCRDQGQRGCGRRCL